MRTLIRASRSASDSDGVLAGVLLAAEGGGVGSTTAAAGSRASTVGGLQPATSEIRAQHAAADPRRWRGITTLRVEIWIRLAVMRHILRILQALLGIAFAVAGFTKLFMTARMISIAVPPWITSYPELGVSFFGLLELAGGLVLIRQAMLEGLRSRLAFRAALLLASVMLVAVTTHGLRGDLQNIPANAFLLLMCALVAGRHRPVSKHARLANQ